MTMPQAVDLALSRSRVYAALSRGFLYPSSALLAAMADYGSVLEGLGLEADVSFAHDLSGLEQEYQDLFGGQVPACPPYETEYTASHIWMQTQQMADIAGFYRAFGVDTTETGDRTDSLTAELEFMYMLCMKEAVAEDAGNAEAIAVCRDAQGKFLKEHLAVWLPRFVARLEKAGAEGYYPALARLTERFVATDATRFPREGA
ncbi:MAG TPA: molecular chaperone TorD family protein [Symbiobacteriaceae bacterium]|nr:molecular chaperone TorD family protein [Symbiobacteriaceae bacterium]